MRRYLALVLTVVTAACATPRDRTAHAPVMVGIVAFNDFHGALEPPRQAVIARGEKPGETIQVPAGGAAWLASAIDSVRAKYANHLTVSAGDLISASQIASSLYLDEPTIGVMNRIGLDYNAVGNHEFDRGRKELLRMQHGGCAKHTLREPCAVEPRFRGAKFGFLAAGTKTGRGGTLFPATALRSFGKGRARVTVGLIGLTLSGTPALVSPEGIAGLAFADEAETINALAPQLRSRGADAVVVLIHQGGAQTPASGESPDPDACAGFAGPIRDVLDRIAGVDVVISGHTHQAYVCDYGLVNPARPVLLTSAGNYGELVTDISLAIDPAANAVVAKQARNIIVQSQPWRSSTGQRELTDAYPRFAPRADIADYVALYTRAVANHSGRKAGSLAEGVRKGEGIDGGPLGNLIADAQLAATGGAGAQIALTNPFGIRASLTPAPDGSVTFGAIYAVQPFANALVTQTLSGAQLKAVLEQNFRIDGPAQVLTPSAGFTYSYDLSKPFGERISQMRLNGRVIDPATDYRVTTNSFLANGGDDYKALTGQRDAVIGMVDLDALELWLKISPARAVPREERATALKP